MESARGPHRLVVPWAHFPFRRQGHGVMLHRSKKTLQNGALTSRGLTPDMGQPPRDSSAAPTRQMGRRRWPMGADMLLAMQMRPYMPSVMPTRVDMPFAMLMRTDMLFAMPIGQA